MSTFANIITNCVFFFVFAIIMLVSILIFIQAILDLWDKIGRDVFRSINDWFRRTDVGARMINLKNGITILTDDEYEYGVKPWHLNERINREIAEKLWKIIK